MAVKHRKKVVLACAVTKDGTLTAIDIPKTPHVRVFGVLTPIKESEIPRYQKENFKIEWL